MHENAESSEPGKPKPDDATVRLAFEESKEINAKLDEWIEAIDRKIVTLFTLSSGVAGLVPAIAETSDQIWIWRGGGAAWLVAAVLCLVAFWPRKMLVSPDPVGIYRPKWLAIDEDRYRMKRLGSLGTIYKENIALVSEKARLLRFAMLASGVEIGLFALAIFL